MAGRGRGFGREPMKMLRRPLNIEEDFLSKKLTEMSLSEANESEMSAVKSEVRKMATSKESLKKAVSLLYKYSHQSKRHAMLGALLFKDLIDLAVDDISTRKLLLNMLQVDFEGIDNNITNPNKFLSQVTFLCEVFHNLRIHGTPLKVLGVPVMEYFERLLNGNQEEFDVLFEQFPKNEAALEQVCHEKVSDFLLRVRKKLVTDTTLNTTSRILLLGVLECSFKKKTSLEPEVVKLYEKISNLKLHINL